MGESEKLLQMKHISKRFPGVVALENVSFELEQGEIHALLGENGAGKSTLIKVLTAVEKYDEGEVYMLGKKIDIKTPQEAQHTGISTVYQEVNLCTNLSVAENIYIGREPMGKTGIDWKTINEQAKVLLEKFDLQIDVTSTLDKYSVAIQQMVAIARAVDQSSKVLILDEPTSSLSKMEVEKLFKIMKKLKGEGLGIIFVTHFLDQVYEVCDRITVLRNGTYVCTDTTTNLSRIDLVGRMIGKDYEELEKQHIVGDSGKEKACLMVLEGAGSTALKNVDMTINKGEVLGLSGLLGSGRSELARLIFGVDSLTEGSLTKDGSHKKFKEPLEAMRSGIAFCPENRKTEGIIGDLSIRENIILALQAKRGMFKPISRVEAERITKEYIDKIQIKTPSSDQLIKNLSGGNQQKVILARWLATSPELIILDEPTRGIDIGTKAEIQKIVMELAEKDMAVIFISSELDEMLRCCEKMVILRDREKVAELMGEAISEASIMEYIAGGTKHE